MRMQVRFDIARERPFPAVSSVYGGFGWYYLYPQTGNKNPENSSIYF